MVTTTVTTKCFRKNRSDARNRPWSKLEKKKRKLKPKISRSRMPNNLQRNPRKPKGRSHTNPGDPLTKLTTIQLNRKPNKKSIDSKPNVCVSCALQGSSRALIYPLLPTRITNQKNWSIFNQSWLGWLRVAGLTLDNVGREKGLSGDMVVWSE